MALEYSTVEREAAAVVDIASQAASLLATIDQLLKHNTALAIDWGAGATPAYISEAANGNMQGKTYTRQQIANAIGTFQQMLNLASNQTVTEGNHLGNLNLIARPLG